MLGVATTVLTQNLPELGVVQQRPYLRVDGALEVVGRLPRLPCLQQHLEVFRRAARDPRSLQRVAQQRVPTARRRADEVGHSRNRYYSCLIFRLSHVPPLPICYILRPAWRAWTGRSVAVP